MLHLFTTVTAIACCLALFQSANPAAAYESERDDTQSVTLVPIEPVPDADDGVGEISLSDFDFAAKSHAGFAIDTPVRPVSLKSKASLKSEVGKKPAADRDSIIDDNTFDDSTCDDCLDYCSSRSCVQHWVRADYLLWWTRGSNVPPLVTTSTNQDDGVLGRPTTEILFGGSRETSDARSAPRITMGYWFDCCQTQGIQFDYFNLGQASNNYDNYSDGTTLLARPFYSTTVYNDPIWGYIPKGQWRELVAKQNVVEGGIRVNSDDYFQSLGILGRLNICCRQTCGDDLCCEPDDCCDDCGGSCQSGYCGGRNRGSLRYFLHNLLEPAGRTTYRVDFIVGYRNCRLDDKISITENLVVQDLYEYNIQDSFRASNEFHGGELGLVTQIHRGRWSLELLAKMALGNNSSIVDISGSTDISRLGDDPEHYDAGVFALETNIGRYHNDQFVVIPQFGVEVGYDLTCSLRAYIGYNFLYWANVARAAEQIDTNINASYIPPSDPTGDPAPLFSRQDSDFWAQGLNFGLEWQF